MSDAIETIGNSLVKHGPSHDRAYLMKHPTDASAIIDDLEQLACSVRLPVTAEREKSSGDLDNPDLRDIISLLIRL